MNTHYRTTREERHCFRIAPPPHLVKELAVWFMPPMEGHVLPMEKLGPPHVCSVNSTTAVRLENISGSGMCFSIAREALPCCPNIRSQHCYIYLKLRPVLPGKHQLTCVFAGLQLLRAETVENRVRVRGKILTKGAPYRNSKAFQLMYVERAGVRDLTLWCKEIDRMGRGLLPPVAEGLDLEYLLMELSPPATPPFPPEHTQYAYG